MGEVDHLQFLVASATRQAILERLYDTEVITTAELETLLDVSRRTITRALTAFEQRGYVHASTDGYRLTALGEYCHEEFAAATATMAELDRLEPILTQIKAADFEVPLEAFADATVTEPTPTNPYAAFDRMATLRASATTVRMAIHILSQRTVAQLVERAREPAFEAELLISESYVTAAEQAPVEESPGLEGLAAADGVSVRIVERTIPYMVGMIDDTVTIGVRENRSAVGVLEVDSEPARAWARDRFATLRAAARPYTP